MQNLILPESNPQDAIREIVGGKGEYLVKLHQASAQLKTFAVPDFYIIPINYSNSKSDVLLNAFDSLKKPVIVRSSSPLEDGINASFAGMFESCRDVSSFEDFQEAYQKVINSPHNGFIKRYSERMSVDFDSSMAVIVQEQITNPWLKGIIHLDDEYDLDASFRCEFTDKKNEPNNYELKFDCLDILEEKICHKPRKELDSIREGDFWALAHAALDAKKALGLEGVVQVEACFSPDKPIYFVQIRKLPQVASYAAELDLDVPAGVPYIESAVCNDIAGDIVLPAYVTTSQSGLKGILIETGQSGMLFLGSSGDNRAEQFYEKSKLASNRDFQQFRDLMSVERTMGLRDILPYYNETWRKGNSLFNEYILVCDKLDETIAEMADATSNKKAIITCLESTKTSHAMTVARDLGIMCMSVSGDLYEMDDFYHQIETGDMIRMKSDGKRAVAYIEKKRTADPYIK